MRNNIFLSFIIFVLAVNINAQNDTMYIMKNGLVIKSQSIKTSDVDSIIFYKPANKPINPVGLQLVNIPAGTFTMGSPLTEKNRKTDETQYQVTLSTFLMCKYEITNTQFATFLNAKSIGSDGKYAAGTYPTQQLIYPTSGSYDCGLHYTGGKWVPVAGYESHPIINVTWYGATEFATYAGGTLPTEAQWEYACRANTTTPFNTGACLSDAQAWYNWSTPYFICTNSNSSYLGGTHAVSTYPANAFGLHNMHGNVFEWCSDWYGTYPTSAQSNPKGASTGTTRVSRGGDWGSAAMSCRSAYRRSDDPASADILLGFRVVLVP